MILNNDIVIRILITLVVLLILLVLRYLSISLVRKKHYANNDMKMRAVVFTRRVFFLIIIFSITFIWLTQLRNFAFSIAAIAVAVVIATKEVISCIIGGLVKSYSQSFKIGDRIDIGGFRGDVVDIDILCTSLLEIGPGNSAHQYTGRSISIPNSIFLSKPVINETYTDDYILHVFTIPISSTSNWKRAEKILLEVSNQIVADYLDDAKRHMEKLGNKTGIESPSVEPRVSIVVADIKKYNLLVRVPVPSRRKGKIEQAIIRQFLENWKNSKDTSRNTEEAELNEDTGA